MPTATPVRNVRVSMASRSRRVGGAGPLLVWLGVGVAGVVVALLACWVSRAVWRPGPVAVPWGLALGIAGSGAGVWLAKAWARSAGYAAATGWVVGIAYLVPGGPGGDLLIINDRYGNGFLLLGVVFVVGTAGWGSWRR